MIQTLAYKQIVKKVLEIIGLVLFIKTKLNFLQELKVVYQKIFFNYLDERISLILQKHNRVFMHSKRT